jgi:hypothetical protein
MPGNIFVYTSSLESEIERLAHRFNGLIKVGIAIIEKSQRTFKSSVWRLQKFYLSLQKICIMLWIKNYYTISLRKKSSKTCQVV